MKKKLEEELVRIAYRILQRKDTSTLPQLQEEARLLYEKLSILNFTEMHFADAAPTIDEIKTLLEEQNEAGVTQENKELIKPKPIIDIDPETKVEEIATSTLSFEKKITETPIEEFEETKPEIIIEKINEKVTEDLFIPAPPKFTEENVLLSEPEYEKNDKEDIGSMPQSMPILDKISDTEEKPKSLNDQLKKGINIGLNDRLAFIKHLFDGSATDYNRVLSQLNTLNSKSGARQFIKNMVKPDYNNWEGKNEYEERFIEIVSNKYEF